MMEDSDIIRNECLEVRAYEDALSPAMKQVGETLESVSKVARFLFAPIEYVATYQDRWQRYLSKVAEKVPEENLVEGHPQIVIPVLEGLGLQYEGSLLSELFIKLLANSIDKTKQDLAHPAFPNIISNLSSDEAKILFYLKKKPYKIKQKSDFSVEKKVFINKVMIEEEFPVDQLDSPNNIWLYNDHLNSLNLAGTFQLGKQEIIQDKSGKQIGVFIRSERRLMEFGQFFAKACVPDELP